jgi:hypothetical protein
VRSQRRTSLKDNFLPKSTLHVIRVSAVEPPLGFPPALRLNGAPPPATVMDTVPPGLPWEPSRVCFAVVSYYNSQYSIPKLVIECNRRDGAGGLARQP